MTLFSRPLALATLAVVLAPQSQAQVNDKYLLNIDTVQTSVQFTIETDLLGLCLPVASSDCPIVGNLNVELHGGLLPLQTCKYDGGDVTCVPNLLAYVPNLLPALPNLLEVDVVGLRLAPNSPTFPVLANGTFTVNEVHQVLDGLLTVRPLGLDAITVPLVGMTTDVARTHGVIQIDDNGIRIVRQVGNTLLVDLPILNTQIRIALRGYIEAQFHYPLPSEVCTASLNHLGLAADLALSGTVSLSRNDLFLHCHDAVPGARSIGLLGHVQANVTFGNGTLCIGGSLVRLGGLNLGLDGSGSVAVHLGNLGVQVGTTHLLQVVYRDGLNFNLSNALQILACP